MGVQVERFRGFFQDEQSKVLVGVNGDHFVHVEILL